MEVYSLHPKRTAAGRAAVFAHSLQGNALLSSAEPFTKPAVCMMLCRYENCLSQAATVPKPVQANIVVMGQDEFHDALESAAESASIASTSSDRQLESGQQASAACMFVAMVTSVHSMTMVMTSHCCFMIHRQAPRHALPYTPMVSVQCV